MILRGPECLQYPSRKEFQHLGEIMHQVRGIQRREELPSLTAAVGQLVPHEFAGCGAIEIQKLGVQVGHSNFSQEYAYLYATQGLAMDPAIRLLQMTRIGTVTSEDSPSLTLPRSVTNLKVDFGIKSCLTVGIRGVLGTSTYFAFSNFDTKLLWKLRTIMQVLAPHFHLAYAQAVAMAEEPTVPPTKPTLTIREQEIMKWVAEGKTNWEISVILGVSLNTVKFHLKNIYQKFGGVENRWAAVAQWQWTVSGLVCPASFPGSDPDSSLVARRNLP